MKLRAWWFNFTNKNAYLEGLKIAELECEVDNYNELCSFSDFCGTPNHPFDKGICDYVSHAERI